MRVVVCVGLFATPSWVFAALVVSAGLMLPFLHTMAYGVTRALLDERLWETHGWWMHTSSGGDGWRRYFPDQNPWVRLSLFVVGAIFMAYYEVHYSGQ